MLTLLLSAVYRLNTFPLMHLNSIHLIFNVIALTPLLERFEGEFGTLVTLAIYTLLEKYVLRSNTTVMGARYARLLVHYIINRY